MTRAVLTAALMLALTTAIAHSAPAIPLVGQGTEWEVDAQHGSLSAGSFEGRRAVAPSHDQYWWVTDAGKTVCSEDADVVLSQRVSPERADFVCRVPEAGVEVRKEYWLAAGGRALAKRVTAPHLTRRGVLRVRSGVELEPAFRTGASYYCQRQSWVGAPQTTLFGVRRAAEITKPVVSSAGWDPRLVVAFDDNIALGHYRLQVRGQYVPPSSVIGAWAERLDQALRYTPTGWDFELLHTVDGEPDPVDATVYYHFCRGDFRDLWREYQQLPEVVATYDTHGPEWVRKAAVSGFWNLIPERTAPQVADAHALARKLGNYTLPLGVFAWSLDGDYETDAPFLNENMSLIMTPEWFGARLREFQSDPRVKLGAYIQGSVFDTDTAAFREHPEWAMQTAAGKPFFSGFRDNPLGEMPFFNILSPFAEHFLSRVKAVCERYDPGWIYLDGGAMFESTEWRLRRPILPDSWMKLHRALRDTIKQTGPDRALLMNAQNMPFADLYWLECSYFSAGSAWRDTVEFCYDTVINHDPERTMLPLYWQDELRYLAMCVACGFTPCTGGVPSGGDFSPLQWRAIQAAAWMRDSRPVLAAGAVKPDWLREATEVVAFAQRLPGHVVVPVLSMGKDETVALTLSLDKLGLPADATRVQVVRPLQQAGVEDLGRLSPTTGALRLTLPVKTGWSGLTLVALGSKDVVLPQLPVTTVPAGKQP